VYDLARQWRSSFTDFHHGLLEQGQSGSKQPVVDVEVRVEYVGSSGRRYFTFVAMSGKEQAWEITRHEIGWVNKIDAEDGAYRLTPC
jgi:hypothetical protein